MDGSSRSNSKNGERGRVDGNGVVSAGESRSLGIKEIIKLLSPIIVMSIAFFVSFSYHSFINVNNGGGKNRINLDGMGVS